ncbi:UNVERIFIED_CONTAM: hypothetical protein PYX00_009415 [Menopon gallinae]|uniref:PH domain-containing protein n=1 Tax=Menopon gallinae TaxID=328185 RepID=A0AAW2HBE8_9NEOP
MSENKTPHADAEMKGWLFKWTNYLKGYQRRWFVLSNGLLSYYRNQAEMAHTCRGTVSLHGAMIHTEDSCSFVISNGGTQTFHIKAANEIERQKWVTALELAKAKAIRAMESEEDDEEYDKSTVNHKAELANTIKTLSAKLEELQTFSDLIAKHGTALQRSLSELESLDSTQDVSGKIKTVNERATLFRITSSAMIVFCSEYLDLAQTQGKKWQKMLQHERDQRQRLEEMVEQLARQHSHLEQAAKDHHIPRQTASPSDEDDENEFYDAHGGDDDGAGDKTDFILEIPVGHRRTASSYSQGSQGDASGSSSEPDDPTQNKTKTMTIIGSGQPGSSGKNSARNNPPAKVATNSKGRGRRTRVPDKPNQSLNLWSIMKNCIGKELSKIPMPVNFSEPLSMLQRLTEDYEYAEILDKAATCKDSCEQLAYVAAFTVSSYSTTASRTGKPFNPLLGETYECDRSEDLGWRAISEQVSHHPPMLAQYCEGKDWKCWQEFTMTSKFRGKYLQVVPLGIAHLVFDNTKNHYTWRKVTTTVHNIIVGKLWVDQHGDMDIVNHTTKDKCHLKYIPYSYFSKDSQRKVKGCVMNGKGEMKWVVTGEWDQQIEIAPVISSTGSPDNPVITMGPSSLAWLRKMPHPDSEKYYNFTELACQLNEPEEGVAPTDSRLRPDQRLMEEGNWAAANIEKVRLEEKQRAVRRQRESDAEVAASSGQPYRPYEPIWFKQEKDPITGSLIHVYNGKYWEAKAKKDWSMCPDIF